MGDFFKDRESEGRDKFSRLFSKEKGYTVEFTDDPYCRYDAMMTGKTGNEYVVEIKNVHRPFKQYDDFLIDAQKVDGLHDAGIELSKTPLITGFFTDGTLIWDVTTTEDIPRTEAWCTATTASYEHGKKRKEMCRLTEERAAWRSTK